MKTSLGVQQIKQEHIVLYIIFYCTTIGELLAPSIISHLVTKWSLGFFRGKSPLNLLSISSHLNPKRCMLYIYINWQSIGKSYWRFCRCLITHLSLILLPHTHKDIVKFITLVHTHVNTCISIKLATLFLLFIFYYFNSFEFFGSAFMHQNQGCFKLSCIYII